MLYVVSSGPEKTCQSPFHISEPFTWRYLHRSNPLDVKANRPTTAAAAAAGGDWNTKATAAVTTVTIIRALLNIIIPPYARTGDQEYHAPDGRHSHAGHCIFGQEHQTDGQHDPFHSFSPGSNPRNRTNLGNLKLYDPSWFCVTASAWTSMTRPSKSLRAAQY